MQWICTNHCHPGAGRDPVECSHVARFVFAIAKTAGKATFYEVTMKKRGLGRSLNAILNTKPEENDSDVAVLERQESAPAQETVVQPSNSLPLTFLQRGQYQPRREMDQDALQELADSIKQHGILQPILVRKLAESSYEIIAGERRYRAAELAGLAEIPVIVKDIPNETAMAIGLIENIQRENLNPIEEAGAFQRLLNEFGLTHQEVANSVGRSRTAVSNMLRLLNLNESVQRFVENGDIEMGHARALLSLEGEDQLKAAMMVVERGLSVRETEQLAKNWHQSPSMPTRKPATDPDVLRLQDKFTDRLGLRVKIKHNSNGKGKIVISYKNLTELDAVLDKIE